MPYLVVYTEHGEQVGTVDVHELTPKRGVQAQWGWDGMQFDRLWREALISEERRKQSEEYHARA